MTLSPDQLAVVDWLYRNAAVLSRKDNDDGSVTLELQATPAALAELGVRAERK